MLIFGCIILVFFIIWLLLLLCLRSSNGNRVSIIAHRGLTANAPENTLMACRHAFEMGVLEIEIDVRRTADNVIVLLHDENIARTTNGVGLISNLLWQDLGAFFVGDRSLNEHIPKLTDVLNLVVLKPIKLYIEVKEPEKYPGIFNQINETLRNYRFIIKPSIISFDENWIINKKNKFVELGLLKIAMIKLIEHPNISSIHLYWLNLFINPILIWRMHNRGLKVIAWTPNNIFIIKVLMWLGVDGITTDEPLKSYSVLS